MKPIVYLVLQMRLEGIEQAGDDLIAPIAPERADFPLVLVARTVDGELLAAADIRLAPELRQQFSRRDLEACRGESALQVLRRAGIEAKGSQYRTYVFPDLYASADVVDVRTYDEADQKIADFGFAGMGRRVFAIERDGRIQSACVSSRQDSACAEAWAFTDPEHRRKGLAHKVVTAWATSLLKDGVVPLCSHRIDNPESGHLARSLGLIPAFDEMVITRVSAAGKDSQAVDRHERTI